MPEVIQYAAGIITAIGAVVAIVYGGRAARFDRDAKRDQARKDAESARHEQDIEGVKVSVDSLQKSNAELRIDNTQLRVDITALRVEMRQRDLDCTAKLLALQDQIRLLGGTPGRGS